MKKLAFMLYDPALFGLTSLTINPMTVYSLTSTPSLSVYPPFTLISTRASDWTNAGEAANAIATTDERQLRFIERLLISSKQAQVGFLFGQQFSTLELKTRLGTTHDAADMKVNNYHGIFTYNFGYGDSQVRPFIFGGLGATNYSPGDANGFPVESNTRFSTTWGGGVKFYATENIGFNFTARWVPTYINSSDAGIWCSPYWPGGCWVLSEANYSNQFDLSGGVNFKF